MTLLIIVSVIAALFAIGAYQMVIHKYYWGPKGQPKKEKRKQADRIPPQETKKAARLPR